MSAAAPLPPSGVSHIHAMNGYTNGAHGVGADGWRGGDGAADPRGPVGPYPPISEIVASAGETVEGLRHHSVYRAAGASHVAFADRK